MAAASSPDRRSRWTAARSCSERHWQVASRAGRLPATFHCGETSDVEDQIVSPCACWRPSPPARPPWNSCAARSPRRRRSLSQSGLVGEIQGPTMITDPAKWPKKFTEAPMLAELVKAGQAAAGRAAHPGRTDGLAAAERDRQVRRHLAARLHRPGGRRERQPHPVLRQAAVLERRRQQDRALRRQGLRAERRRQDLHAASCARA